MAKPITDYKITDHGVEHSQYFQGAGVAFTKWEECFTGIGNSPAEALEDALEQVAQGDEWAIDSLPDGWDEGLLNLVKDRVTEVIESQCDCEECKVVSDAGKVSEEKTINCTHDCECYEMSELHCFVTLYVK